MVGNLLNSSYAKNYARSATRGGENGPKAVVSMDEK